MTARMHDTKPPRERALVVGLSVPTKDRAWSIEASMDELVALAGTAGLDVVATAYQRLHSVNPATLVGSGKLEEIRLAADDAEADLVLVDRELSPRQQRNLEEAVEVKVVDRTALILDIFAQHARSREGMLQVELAQYEYRLPRLTRMWTHLARQAGGRAGGTRGGVGVRGPGETQLEIDRREVRRRIAALRRDIEALRQQRDLHRRQRRRAGLPVVAVVGYTNAGKSTLLNAVSRADIHVADRLFATLDPTTRRVDLPSGRTALFTDTVGFIQNLPTELAAAFKATLEEIGTADVLVHVVDATHPDVILQCETVESILGDLGLADRPMVVAANKIDLLTLVSAESGVGPGPPSEGAGEESRRRASAAAGDQDGVAEALGRISEVYPDAFPVSATQGYGIGDLLRGIDAELQRALVTVDLLIPYKHGDVLAMVRTHGAIHFEQAGPEGTRVTAAVPPYLMAALDAHRVDSGAGASEPGSHP